MTYDEALEFIHESKKFGVKLGLSNIKELLKRLGNPDKDLKFIHVAGTNGKGTVTAAISSILKEQGYRAGTYTSPFVYTFNERISINGSLISNEDLALCTEKVKSACAGMVNDGLHHPTEFEIVTAIGMVFFHCQECEFVVLEVGMGGRLDATNAIDAPLVSVITSISYDHTEYLGNTLSEIAFEKCGILKEGTLVSVYPNQEKEALEVILKTCDSLNIDVYIAPMPTNVKSNITCTVFDFEEFKNLKLHILGEHMTRNIATAITAVKLLRTKGIAVSDEAVVQGVNNVRWPGRFEIINENPLMVIDGAHNISGIEAFKNTLTTLLPDVKKVFIMGMLRDKEYDKCLKRLGGLADLLITVDVPSPRTLSANELYHAAIKYNKNIYAAKSLTDAADKALNFNKSAAILAFGSLYMIGDMKKELLNLYKRQ